MKKSICLVLSVILLSLSLSACASNPSTTQHYLTNVNGNKYTTTTVQAYGATLDARQYVSKLTSSEVSEAKKYVKQYFNATYKAKATLSYNCHSYAWYNQSTSNKYWINDPSPCWKSGNATLVVSGDLTGIPASASKGDIGVYCYNGRVDHSAVVKNVSKNTFTSKWGQLGLYEHEIDDCPYNYCDSINYYN